MLFLRVGWILGVVSTAEYHSRVRNLRYGDGAPKASDATLRRMERALTADRLAVVLFLLGTVLLVYAWMHGPVLT